LIGPIASEGPPFVTFKVAVPMVPGVIGDVNDEVDRSAWPGPAATDAATVLFSDVGSLVALDATADPPVYVELGVAFAGMLTGTATVAFAPLTIGPGCVQVIGPAGIVPVQPTGRVVILTPFGAV
jgi:hypothetical protein